MLYVTYGFVFIVYILIGLWTKKYFLVLCHGWCLSYKSVYILFWPQILLFPWYVLSGRKCEAKVCVIEFCPPRALLLRGKYPGNKSFAGGEVGNKKKRTAKNLRKLSCVLSTTTYCGRIEWGWDVVCVLEKPGLIFGQKFCNWSPQKSNTYFRNNKNNNKTQKKKKIFQPKYFDITG